MVLESSSFVPFFTRVNILFRNGFRCSSSSKSSSWAAGSGPRLTERKPDLQNHFLGVRVLVKGTGAPSPSSISAPVTFILLIWVWDHDESYATI